MNFIIEPWHWFVLGIVLIVSELLLPAFAAIWFGIAALLVCILLCIFPSMGFVMQILLWIIFSVVCTVLWFKWIKPMSFDKTTAGLSRESAIGQVGMVIEAGLDHHLVKVRFHMPLLGADEWNCRTLAAVNVGDRVRVTDILGNDLVVQPHHASEATPSS